VLLLDTAVYQITKVMPLVILTSYELPKNYENKRPEFLHTSHFLLNIDILTCLILVHSWLTV